MASPEIALWRAVVLQMFIDATGHARTRYQQHSQAMARQWLVANSEGFRAICALADLSPRQVRAQADRFAKLGWPARKFNLSEPKGVFA